MALPPIISNSPIARLLTGANATDRAAENKPAEKAKESSGPRDTVTLSDEAIQKLSETEARQKSQDVRQALAQDENLTLSNGQDSFNL